MVIQMPHVPKSDRFTHVMGHLKADFPHIHDDVWNSIKRSDSLDPVHYDAVFNDDEEAYGKLLGVLPDLVLNVAGSTLGGCIVVMLHDWEQNFVTHCEVAQASQLEPHEEAAVWDMWERIDAQQSHQERIDLYRNEY